MVAPQSLPLALREGEGCCAGIWFRTRPTPA